MTMRRLAMRFRGILRSKNVAKLGVWLTDAHQSGLYAMQRFARTLRVITHRHFLGARIRAMRLISARPLARESNL
jgi:hypothetical protein